MSEIETLLDEVRSLSERVEYLIKRLESQDAINNTNGAQNSNKVQVQIKDEIWSRKEAEEYLGVSQTTFWRLKQDPDFPERINLSKRLHGYFAKDVIDYAKSQQPRD